MAEEKVAKVTKVKKKKWIEVLAPKLFRDELIGEIPVDETKSLVGRTVTVNLMNLTRDIKKQNIDLRFVIASVQGDTAATELTGYFLNNASIRRLSRRGKERIDLSFTCKTSDNRNIRLKPLMIPPADIKGSVSAALKKGAVNYLTSYAAKNSFENIVGDLIMNKLQKGLKDELKKIYPIRILEIGKLYLEKETKHGEDKKITEEKAGEEQENKTEEVKEPENEMEEVKEEEPEAEEKPKTERPKEEKKES